VTHHPCRDSAPASLTSLTSLNSPNALSPGSFQDQVQISFVSHLIEDGVDPLFVQQQAGHSWASTTATYTTVGADARNRMLRRALARAFGEGEGK
jgi:hypothetical protein